MESEVSMLNALILIDFCIVYISILTKYRFSFPTIVLRQ